MDLISMHKNKGKSDIYKDKNKDKEYFFYKISHTEYKMLLADILYFESKGRQVRMVLLRGEYIFYDTLKNILKRINRGNFIHVHKGFIVNYNYVIAFSSNRLELPNDMIIPIGLSKKMEVKQAITKCEKVENI